MDNKIPENATFTERLSHKLTELRLKISRVWGRFVAILQRCVNYLTGKNQNNSENSPTQTPVQGRKVTHQANGTELTGQASTSINEIKHNLLTPAPGSSFSPIFYNSSDSDHSKGIIASLNSGNPTLSMNQHNGINSQFSKQLNLTDQNRTDYQQYRKSGIRTLKRGQIETIPANNLPKSLQSSTVYYDCLVKNKNKKIDNPHTINDGTVFVEEFKSGHYPHNDKRNGAMIYIIPPNRQHYGNDDDFLDAVQKTTKNIIATLDKCNTSRQARGLSLITGLRLCAFSGGEYAQRTDNPNQGSVSDVEILKAIRTVLEDLEPHRATGLTHVQYSCHMKQAMPSDHIEAPIPTVKPDEAAQTQPTDDTVEKTLGSNQIYYAVQDNQKPLASLNAGDPKLFTGGKGITVAFADAMNIKKDDAYDKSIIKYREHLLKTTAKNACYSEIIQQDSKNLTSDIFQAVTCYNFQPTSNEKTKKMAKYGQVFVEEFREGRRPNNIKSNTAMLYLVPPNRLEFDSDNDFLQAVKQSGENIVHALCNHNQWCKQQQREPIPVMKVCAFSSGIFASRSDSKKFENKVDSDVVCRQIIQGINDAIKKKATKDQLMITKIEFSAAFKNVFKS